MGEAADNDDQGGGLTNRYQAVPSLQSLQKMRNRLHKASLGRRLMKWTAIATGKELRRISDKLAAYQEITFNQEFTQALIMLARCRFHNPEFHKVLLNNVGNTEGPLAHPYTCIGRGGEVLKEARRIWHKLLKHLMEVLQLRENFSVVYKANGEARKKENVMGKIIIPKTMNTIQYIINELEEMNREDFFRLKKIKEVRNKNKAKKTQKYAEEAKTPCEHVCHIPNFDDVDAEVCQSCSTVPPTARCQVKEKESSHMHSGTKLTEYLDNSFNALAKVMDENTLPDCVMQDLSNFIHNFTLLRNKLTVSPCEKEYKKNMPSFPGPSTKPSKYNFETLPVKYQKSTLSPKITPKHLEIVKVEAELDEGTFEVEYKEVTTIKRTKGPDGKIKEETEVVKTTIKKDLSKHLEANTSSHGGRSTLSREEPEVQTTKSLCTKMSNVSTALRSCVSWCVHSPSKTLKGDSDKDEITAVQRQNAQKGVILLPGEMSNKVAREVGTSKKGFKKDDKEEKDEEKKYDKVKKDENKKDRHENCFKD